MIDKQLPDDWMDSMSDEFKFWQKSQEAFNILIAVGNTAHCSQCREFLKNDLMCDHHEIALQYALIRWHCVENGDTSIGVALTKDLDYSKKEYTRPDLTDEDKKQAEQTAKTLLRKYGYTNFPKMMAALCLENVRLVKEINEHREARGIALLEVHEV